MATSIDITNLDWNIHNLIIHGNLFQIHSVSEQKPKFSGGNTLCKFVWGWYVIIFLYMQFWIRLAAASYRDKKVQTVASPAVRSVNKSRDTRNCAQKGPEYAICVIFTTRLYYKALGLILCDHRWQICHHYNCLDDGHCEVTGHRKMSVLGTAGALVTTHEYFVMMWRFKGLKLFCVL